MNLPLVEPAHKLINSLTNAIGSEVGWNNHSNTKCKEFDSLGVGNWLSQETFSNTFFSLIKFLPKLSSGEQCNCSEAETRCEKDGDVESLQLTHEVSKDVVTSVVDGETFGKANHSISCLDENVSCSDQLSGDSDCGANIEHNQWSDPSLEEVTHDNVVHDVLSE